MGEETETEIDLYQEAQEAQGGQEAKEGLEVQGDKEADPIQEGVESKFILQNIVHVINIETEMIRGPQNGRDHTREAVGLLLQANTTKNQNAEKIDQYPQSAVEGHNRKIRDDQGNRGPEPPEAVVTPVMAPVKVPEIGLEVGPEVGPVKDQFLVSPSKTNLTTRKRPQKSLMANFLIMKSTVRKQMRLR